MTDAADAAGGLPSRAPLVERNPAVTDDAPAGTLVMIPPGAAHTFANPSDGVTVLLNTFTPDLYVQYFRDLRDMIAAGRQLTPDAAIEAMRPYATEPATEPRRP